MKLILFSYVLLLAGVTYISAQPEPGDVFREYYWRSPSSDADYALRVSNEGNFDQGYGGGTITLSHVFDLEHAVKAEIIIEKIQSHEGTKELEISVNDNDWTRVPDAENIPSPQYDYLHHIYPVMEIPLSWLKEDSGNGFRMKVSPVQDWEWPQHLINGVHFRIYYDPGLKSHPTGGILEPSSGSGIGESVTFTAEAASPDTLIKQVDYVGLYEDVNYEGDGIYYQWHYHYYHGVIMHHIGTATTPPYQVTWDTSWVPDQERPINVSARIIDKTGLIYMTPPVTGLELDRDGVSVELCKPYDVSKAWTTRSSGKGEKFDIVGNPAEASAAQLVWTSWSPGYMGGVFINFQEVLDKEGPLYKYYFHRVTIDSLSVLKQGANRLYTGYKNTINGEPIHGMEVQWPGMMVLLRYEDQDPVSVREESAPPVFELDGNYPNPFNMSTTIRYTLHEPADVRCRIYSLSGQRLRTLVDSRQGAGEREIIWNGTDDTGAAVSSGVYLFTLEAGGTAAVKKILLMK